MCGPDDVPRPARGLHALWASIGVSSIGDGALVAAMPLLAAHLTRSPLAVAAVGAAAALPWFLVGAVAGAWVDRLARRSVLVAAEALRAVALGLLAVATATGHTSIAQLALVAFAVTAGQCFFDAAAQAVLPQVLPRESTTLTKVNGHLYATQTVGTKLAGPPIGGALFGVSPWAPFAVDAASFVASALSVLGVPAAPAPRGSGATGIALSVREGFAYLFASRRLVALATALTAYNLAFNLADSTLVLYAQVHLGVTDGPFGLLLAAMSIGAVLVGLRASQLLDRLGVPGSVVASAVGQALAWFAVAATGSLWVAAGAMVLVGASSTLVTVAVVSERQLTVPDALLGRVTAAFRVIGNGFAPLGGLAGGLIAAVWGLRAPLMLAPVLLVVVFVGLAVTARSALWS